MNRYAAVFVIAALSLACAAQAPQTPPANPLVAEAKGSYNNVKNNILKAAEKMPEENYSFSPTKEERPFIQVAGHVAQAQTSSCSLVKGATAPAASESKTKAELMAALKASFDLCDSAWDSLTDSSALERIAAGRGQAAKLTILWRNTGHDMEQYAIMSGYLRQKGLVPPSSEPRK